MKPVNEIMLRRSCRRVPRPWGIIAGVGILVGILACELWNIFKKQADEISDGN